MHDTEVEDAELLRRFARDRAEDAFAELVRRHLGLVYAAALRQVGGDAHLAQDVAQLVFTDLARKASALAGRDTLAGWLHTSTHHAAANAVRAERRRRKREEEAHAMEELSKDGPGDESWTQVRPVLDSALQELRPSDRDALLLRFFEGRDFAELGARFALSESGARMRVERALDQLRAKLERRGIRSTMAALGAVLASQAAAAPPVGLAAAVTSSALAGSAATATGGAILTFLGMTKIQTAITAVVAVAGLATVSVEVQRAQSIKHEIEVTRPDPTEVARLSTEKSARLATAQERERAQAIATEVEDLRARKAELQRELQPFSATPSATNAGIVAVRPAAPPAGAVGTIYELRELGAMPAATFQTPPRFPFEMKRAGIPGRALVSFVITEDGSVTDVAPEDATHPLFAMAAMDTVTKWKFRPGRKDDLPVNTRVKQPVSFVLNDASWFAP